jgi:hypothetical protein
VGTLALSDFWAEITAGLGNRTGIGNRRLTLALNLAQSRIARSYDFYEMGTTAFGQMLFTGNPAVDKFMVPPVGTKTIHSFVLLDTSSGPSFPSPAVIGSLGQSRKVTEKPWRWFDQRFPAPEWIPAGWPTIYKRFGNIITMVPPPFMQFTAQLSFTQFPQPFDITSPDMTSAFENKDDVLINYAVAYFFKMEGRADRAAYFEGLAKEQLDEAIERDDTRPDIEVSRDVPSMDGTNMGPWWQVPHVKGNP